MSPDRHVHIGLRADVGPWTRSMWQVIRDTERLALQVQEPVAMNADATVRRARPCDHVYGRCIDLPSHIAELYTEGPWPVLQTRATRRAERRRVTRQLRETARERRQDAAERRRDHRRLHGDAWLRGGGTITTHPDPRRSTP